ncbi:MAG: copper amine oxidase N-terminal domain-containing protein [Lentisphaeria bacterium]|nr:copper amine oxidase N-terminal domain-containing protein [Lentisphaeria bacterium]
MKVKPVLRYRSPRYPTREQLESQARLSHVIPSRWKENAALIAILTAAPALARSDGPEAVKKTPDSLVAPLFQHGAGETRGVYGTTFSILPVLLSEEDARQVIEEQLTKAGLNMSRGKKSTHHISVMTVDPKTKQPSAKNVSLTMDGYDSKYGVAYEFLSANDGKETGGSGIELAGKVRDALAKEAPVGIQAIFYDPAPTVYEGMGPAGIGRAMSGMTPCEDFGETTLIPTGFFTTPFLGSSIRVVVEGRRVTLSNSDGSKQAELSVGRETAVINGKTSKLPIPAVEYDGVIYLPFQAVANALDVAFSWDNPSGQLTISLPVYEGRVKNADGVFEQRFEDRDFKSLVTTPTGGENKKLTFAFVAWDDKATRAWAKAEARRLLRLQARDFAAWLKTQGVI